METHKQLTPDRRRQPSECPENMARLSRISLSGTVGKEVVTESAVSGLGRGSEGGKHWARAIEGRMGPPTGNQGASNEKVIDYSELLSRVLQILTERFDSCCAIEVLNRATDGEIYVFGGAIRRAFFGDKLSGDVDIMVPNGDDRATRMLDSLNVPFVLNSQKLRRYRWNTLQIDLFQPHEFFCGFDDVEKALSFFDLRINALALHLRSGRILDPFQIMCRAPATDPGINWTRWTEMSPLNVVILAIRLAKIMHEVPELTISANDAHRLAIEVVPKIRECEWRDLQQRFPPGKDAFLKVFTDSVLSRVRLV